MLISCMLIPTNRTFNIKMRLLVFSFLLTRRSGSVLAEMSLINQNEIFKKLVLLSKNDELPRDCSGVALDIKPGTNLMVVRECTRLCLISPNVCVNAWCLVAFF